MYSSDNKNYSLFSINDKGYSSGELTIPYKNFYNYFEGFFNVNKEKDLQKEKNKQLNFLNNKVKVSGGSSIFDEAPVNTSIEKPDDIEIEKFLFYTLNRDIKIRIATTM
jgi:hypothetical protein